MLRHLATEGQTKCPCLQVRPATYSEEQHSLHSNHPRSSMADYQHRHNSVRFAYVPRLPRLQFLDDTVLV
jgi:hypothetical protein